MELLEEKIKEFLKVEIGSGYGSGSGSGYKKLMVIQSIKLIALIQSLHQYIKI